ncbi:MAG TPA: energy transducer TonB, partial [Opitutaceae bacterium]|nr:energy transducer TonB [Opitutaceae bacterium]
SALAAVALLPLIAAGAPAHPSGDPDFQSAQVVETVEPEFPESLYTLFREGGRAVLELSVDSQGRLADSLPVAYNDRRFADLAVAAVKQWQFKPAHWHGQPVAVTIPLTFDFQVRGVVISGTRSDWSQAYFNALFQWRDAYRAHQLQELDRVPAALRTVSPHYDQTLANRGVSGEVTVKFFIDEQGRVRMASVVGRPDPALADLAIEAIDQWRFTPPRWHGQPVLAQLTQVFRFTPSSAGNRS